MGVYPESRSRVNLYLKIKSIEENTENDIKNST